MKPKLALAALLVAVSLGASGQEPKPRIAMPEKAHLNFPDDWHCYAGEPSNPGNEVACTSFIVNAGTLDRRVTALEKEVAELKKQYRYPDCVSLIDKGGESTCLKKGQYKLYWGRP